MYHDDIEPSVTVPIRDLFSEYMYNSHTQTLIEVGQHQVIHTGVALNFDSKKTLRPSSSVVISGTVSDTGHGFDVSAPGTYIVKLSPGRAYWVNDNYDRFHDLGCVGYACDMASIISTDFDLMTSTSSGFRIVVPQFTGADAGNEIERSNTIFNRDYQLLTSVTSTRISSSGNIYLGGTLGVDFEERFNCYVGRSNGGNAVYYARTNPETAVVPLHRLVPTTTTTDGMTFMTGGVVTRSNEVNVTDFIQGTGWRQGCENRYSADTLPARNFVVDSNTNWLYDRGFKIREHLAHWSDAPAAFDSNVVVNYTGYSRYIPDNYVTGVESQAYVSNDGTPILLSVTVDITHPNIRELSPLVLTAPNGNTRNLYVSGNWTDGGSQTFEPYSSMYSGHDGQWTLRVVDDTAGNTGWLDGWTISATYNTKPTYPIEQSTRQDPFMIPVYGNDVYMVVDKKLPHGTVSVHSETINNSMGLEITNLPSNTLYSITDDDGFEVYGTTGDGGKIMLPNENSWASVINPTLKLFDDTFVIRNMAGMSVYDIQNDLLLHVPVSKFDGVVYGTTQYMKLPLMIDTTVDDVALAVDNCTIATLPLPHLVRNYTTAVDKHIWIPVVPGLGTICITVDGTELVLRLEDFQSGNSAIAVPDQTYSTSSSPGFEFTGGGVPVINSIGDPIENSAGVSSGAMYVAPFTGSMALKVSGSVSGEAETYTIREYSDVSLTGNMADVEDGEIMVGVSVYKNGEYLGYTHLTTFRASGQEFETRHGTFPTGDGRSQWYHTTWSHGTPTSHAGWSKIKTELIPPWHHCDTIRYVHTSGHSGASLYYKCMYRDNPLSNSYCLLDLEYDVYGSFSGNARSFNVEAGDIIEYRISATMSADHSGFDCGNDNTGDYGNTNVKITLRNVLFEHKGT